MTDSDDSKDDIDLDAHLNKIKSDLLVNGGNNESITGGAPSTTVAQANSILERYKQ